MPYRYYIFNGDSWVECSYDSYSKWTGKKYKSAFNVLVDLNNGKIEITEEQKKKQYYASGMTLVDDKWQSCGWLISASSFAEAAKIAEEDETFRIHSLSDNVVY